MTTSSASSTTWRCAIGSSGSAISARARRRTESLESQASCSGERTDDRSAVEAMSSGRCGPERVLRVARAGAPRGARAVPAQVVGDPARGLLEDPLAPALDVLERGLALHLEHA